MIDSRWERIEQLFFEAAELAGHERDAFLEAACGTDVELRREVESLLATDATAFSTIESTIQGAAQSLFAPEDSMVGARLGPWVIVREIGRGGMGTVYLAERADDFQKQVAIKLVKRGIDTDAVLHRFLHERQILASLGHPNIAGLLDGGTSPDGRPYFVLEYVEGVPIQRFCAERKLSIAERCELFRKVCEPVSYAHRNLVIHRDIKPANILVTADGEPKLLDFGIARLLTTEAGDNTIGVESTMRPFTPGYASPEQLRGEAVNTATDVYSLGAVLLQILGGKPPAELDNIVRKAMHEDPARRYPSVDQFSEDLNRYLTGRPVLAREDDWFYTASKFVRRNRVAVAAGALFALLLIVGVVSVLWQARQTRIQRERAEARLGELVEVANETLLNVHGAIERLPGATAARREMVRTTLDYLDKLNRESGNESGGDKRILAAMASAYVRLAHIEGDPLHPNLGDYKGAEESYRKGSKILDELIAANPENIALRLERADCAEGYGQVLDSEAKEKEVNEESTRGLTAVAFVLQRDPKNLKARKRQASLHLLRVLAYTLPQLARAKAEAEALLPITQQMAAEYPNDPDCILNLAGTYSQLGSIANRVGQSQESLANYRKSTELREKLFAIQPNDTDVERELMMSYGHIGDILGSPFLFNLGDSRGAVESYQKAAKIAEGMVAADAQNRQARVDLGVVLGRIGAAMQEPGQAKESLATLERSAQILEKLVAATPGDVTSSTQLSVFYEYEGRRRKTLNDPTGAIASYLRSIGICGPILDAHPTHQACMRQMVIDDAQLGELYAATGDRANAVNRTDSALARAERVSKSGPVAAASYAPRAFAWAGEVYEALGSDTHASAAQRRADWAQAVAYYGQAQVRWKTITPDVRKQWVKDERRLRGQITAGKQQIAVLR